MSLDWVNQILTSLSSIPTADWTALGSWLLAGGGSSVITQLIKHFRQDAWLEKSEKRAGAMAVIVLSVVSLLSSAAYYILFTPNAALSTLAGHFAFIVAAAHFWYWLSVKPIYKQVITLLEDAAKWRSATTPQSTAAIAGETTESFVG